MKASSRTSVTTISVVTYLPLSVACCTLAANAGSFCMAADRLSLSACFAVSSATISAFSLMAALAASSAFYLLPPFLLSSAFLEASSCCCSSFKEASTVVRSYSCRCMPSLTHTKMNLHSYAGGTHSPVSASI